MDPNNVNKNFQDEFNSPLEEKSEDKTAVNDELNEWREWALSYEDENGDVTDCG